MPRRGACAQRASGRDNATTLVQAETSDGFEGLRLVCLLLMLTRLWAGTPAPRNVRAGVSRKGTIMRHLGLFLVGSLAMAACASNNNTPPAASSDTVAQTTNEPNRGPDFSPASSDGLA